MQQGGSSGGDKGNFQKIGEGVGGLMGQAADMGMSWLTTTFGAGMGSLGGWWSQAGRRQPERPFGEEEDRECRRHFEATLQGEADDRGGMRAEGEVSSESRPASGGKGGGQGGRRTYETTRPLYQLGHLAGQNPDYQNRSFDEIEPELRRGWGEEQSSRHGSWPEVRGHVEFGYSQAGRRGGGRQGA